MLEQIKAFLMDEEGASAVEYGLIMGLIAVAIIVVLGALGTDIKGLFTTAATELNTATTP